LGVYLQVHPSKYLPEPDGEEGGVLKEGEGEVEEVLEACLLLLGVEEGEDVDGAQHQREQKLLAGRVARCGPKHSDS
jgi:hypothetical protein